MAPFGPWGDRHVAVAVSGGADSLALAWLASGWGMVTAFAVDHGLRPGSGQEALDAVERVRSWGGSGFVLGLAGLHHGPALAARARRARYAALQDACRRAGLIDLLLGHHAGDQAETLAMRRERGSGPAGLAGMAAVAESAHLRLLRPLLGIAPGRLKATLQRAGLGWVEDPSNRDLNTGRGRVRALQADPDGVGPAVRDAAAEAVAAGRRRAAGDADIARALAHCAIYPGGYAVIPDEPILPAALAALLRAVGGAEYAPSIRQAAKLARAPAAATLAGCRIMPAGRLGPGWLVVREKAAMAPPRPGGTWDGRFRTGVLPPGGTIGAIGRDAAEFGGRTYLPASVRETLPAVRIDGVPHVAFGSSPVHDLGLMIEPDCWPPAGAPFGVAC